MTEYSKRQRVEAVLAGKKADRPPFSFWYHFGPGKECGTAAVDAHLNHLAAYGIDFIKVMNDNPFPRPGAQLIREAADLKGIPVYGGEEEAFARQLQLIADLRRTLGRDIMITSTVFSPWSVLRRLAGPEPVRHSPPSLKVSDDPRDRTLSALLKEDKQAVREALQRIAQSLASFARLCLDAGADGIFLSVRDDWVDTAANGHGTYGEIVREADLTVCDAAKGASFNMLHICGRALDFASFAAYPMQVLNWADRYAGPSIAQAAQLTDKALCAGLDNLNTLAKGAPEDCRKEVADALRQAGSRPIMIAAGCTYDPQLVPQANLHAVAKAVIEGQAAIDLRGN